MLKRVFYTIYHSATHLLSLRQCHKINSVLDLDPDSLKSSGVKVLVLDFDGVLAAHGEEVVADIIYPWLQDCARVYGSYLFLLSNKPTKKRQEFFKQNFPQVKFIISTQKKPYPQGMLHIKNTTGITRQNEIVLIDDRLLTGVLACILSSATPYLTCKPLRNWHKRPIRELFFHILRTLEKILLIGVKK